MATVTTNGLHSHSFTLHNGIRQWCPLSPFLFALFSEPLAATIHQDNSIKGITTSTLEHKIILYADDILLLLQDPQPSLQECFSTIKSSSELSSYSINWPKSTILPLDAEEGEVATLASSYHLTTGHIKYLGINISSKLSDLFNPNFMPLLKSVQDE